MKKSKLVARLLLFTVSLVWILGLYYISILLEPRFLDAMTIYGIPEGVITSFLWAWYWITFILVGVALAYKSFSLVGKWERKEKTAREGK